MIEKMGLRALHRLDPEVSHDLSIRALSMGLIPLPGKPVTSARLLTRFAGLAFANPVGLAAGFDKNDKALRSLTRAGFGFVECGAATPRPQQGNPKPRLFRLSEDRAIINRFGFNNDGADVISHRLRAHRKGAKAGVPVGLNIGANKDSADKAGDFAAVVRLAGSNADFLTVNVSSPNTERLRDLQGAEALSQLLVSVLEARDTLARRPPIFLKIAPDLDQSALADIAAIATDLGIDAIIATNTTLSRDGLDSPHAGQTGGLSGRPLFDRSTRILARLYRLTAGRIPLIGVGGVGNDEDAWQKLRAGASAVQIYSALIYHGLSLGGDIARKLDDRAQRLGLSSLSEITGTGVDDWL